MRWYILEPPMYMATSSKTDKPKKNFVSVKAGSKTMRQK